MRVELELTMPSRNLLYKLTSSLMLWMASAHAQSGGTLTVYLSPPAAQSSDVAGVTTETFNQLSTGVHTTSYVSMGIGTYSASQSSPFAINAHDVFGGGTDSTHSSPTNYFSLGNSANSANPIYVTLSQPAAYFGFWWSTGDQYNRIDLYQGSTLFATFSTQDLLNFLNNGTGTITAANGTQYQTSAYFGNPNIASGSRDASEPFVYVSFAITGASIDKLAFYNTSSTQSAFESDNHSVIFTGSTVVIPQTFVGRNAAADSDGLDAGVQPGRGNVCRSADCGHHNSYIRCFHPLHHGWHHAERDVGYGL
jgi:hypothetical protein